MKPTHSKFHPSLPYVGNAQSIWKPEWGKLDEKRKTQLPPKKNQKIPSSIAENKPEKTEPNAQNLQSINHQITRMSSNSDDTPLIDPSLLAKLSESERSEALAAAAAAKRAEERAEQRAIERALERKRQERLQEQNLERD